MLKGLKWILEEVVLIDNFIGCFFWCLYSFNCIKKIQIYKRWQRIKWKKSDIYYLYVGC